MVGCESFDSRWFFARGYVTGDWMREMKAENLSTSSEAGSKT